MDATNEPRTPRSPRGVFVLGLLAVFGVVVFIGFVALGTWQVHRRAWKHDLIARVDTRVHATPVDAPGRGQWPQVSAANDEYRRVKLTGSFLQDKSVRVRASTELGMGSWLLTPLRTLSGDIVIVNRGFVSTTWCAGKAICTPGPIGTTTISGLLRISEPKGAFLQKNDPSGDRWFSRDVAAIAASKGLAGAAPYFIDADAASSPGRGEGNDGPVGGLTVIAFPDNHLSYAITWFALALLTLVGGWVVWKDQRRKHRR
ncbi:surfeit locus 1 family protein [Luteibacter sp. OK325]|uniref:SURF1 family protein n=1 Tax=Luteibacter sp. OK325 TaxID=2135670 RepID=UPI000D363872|nr:SURF1 family protein [Luteibacter sp. OK325]PTR35422.1 surfeit locus 1 family protein [Luteibacter sp. OK325]